MNTKRIIAITTITTLAAAGLANAEVPNTGTTTLQGGPAHSFMQGLKKFGRHGKGEKGEMTGKFGQMQTNRKAINDAILAGNFTLFQQVASTSPLAKIDQTTFNLLTPQFVARKNAEEQIKTILKNAGIPTPNP
jgi:hypothetical protein